MAKLIGSAPNQISTNGDLGKMAFEDKVSVANINATGTKDATTFLRGDNTFASAGITNAQQFRLSADFQGNNAFPQDITTNIEEVDTYNYSSIGNFVSESSGIFSFSETGIYEVTFITTMFSNGTADSVPISIHLTSNNSTYNKIAEVSGNSAQLEVMSVKSIVDIDDTTNVKIKFQTEGLKTSSVLKGNTNTTETSFTFIRLGDT